MRSWRSKEAPFGRFQKDSAAEGKGGEGTYDRWRLRGLRMREDLRKLPAGSEEDELQVKEEQKEL